jgi:hypothetical protein
MSDVGTGRRSRDERTGDVGCRMSDVGCGDGKEE